MARQLYVHRRVHTVEGTNIYRARVRAGKWVDCQREEKSRRWTCAIEGEKVNFRLDWRLRRVNFVPENPEGCKAALIPRLPRSLVPELLPRHTAARLS